MHRGGTGSRGRWSDNRDLEGERETERHFCVHVCTGAWLAGNFVCGSVGLVVEGDGLFDERSRERLGGGGDLEKERGERET